MVNNIMCRFADAAYREHQAGAVIPIQLGNREYSFEYFATVDDLVTSYHFWSRNAKQDKNIIIV